MKISDIAIVVSNDDDRQGDKIGGSYSEYSFFEKDVKARWKNSGISFFHRRAIDLIICYPFIGNQDIFPSAYLYTTQEDGEKLPRKPPDEASSVHVMDKPLPGGLEEK